MTKASANILLGAVKNLAREAEILYTGFGEYTITVKVQDNKIIQVEIPLCKASIKPE